MKSFLGVFLLGIFISCGAPRSVSSLGYADQKKFEQNYLEASKQKILGNNDKAIALFQKALEIDPNSHECKYQLAGLLYIKKEYDLALENASSAVELSPKYNKWYHERYAHILSHVGKYYEAVKVYEAMIENEPDNMDLYYQSADLHLRDNNPTEAIKTLNSIEAKFGISERTAVSKEKIFLRMGHFNDAVKSIERLVESDPEQYIYLGILGETLISVGRTERALKVLHQLEEKDSSIGRTNQLLYQLYSQKGNKAMADHYLKKSYESEEIGIEEKLELFSPVYMSLKRSKVNHALAKELIDILMETYPQSHIPWIMKGDVHYALNEVEQARVAYLKVLDINGSDHNVWNKVLSTDSRLKDYDMQLKHSNQALELFPNLVGFYISKAYALYDLGSYDECIETCNEAMGVALDQRDISDLYSILAMSFYKQGRKDLAYKNYELSLEALPSNILIMNNYAFILAEDGEHLDRALQLIEQALRARPGDPIYLDTKGWILHKQDKNVEALEVMKLAVDQLPNDMELLEHLMIIHKALGNNAEAQQIEQRLKAISERITK